MENIRIEDGRAVTLSDKSLGIIGVTPVFEKKSDCEKHSHSDAIPFLIRTSDIVKVDKGGK
jgi:hypothetical protein